MSSISNALSVLPVKFVSHRNNGAREFKAGNAANAELIWFSSCRLSLSFQKTRGFGVKAAGDSIDSSRREQGEGGVQVDFVPKCSDSDRRESAFHGIIAASPTFVNLVKRSTVSKSAIGFSLAVTVVLIVARQIMSRKDSYNQKGSVAELVRRGQLRSDRRGVLKPLKYDDPFNNPQVKIEKNNSKLEMCGKVYRLAPVTLTKEEQLTHRRRRSRAYQWKRPTVFLREGDLVPPDVDPDTIRWIPANHPFATTAPEIDETLAQNNVFQKEGVPYRIRAEHEALQKKLEALQTTQKESGINQKNIHEVEGSTKPSVNEHLEPSANEEMEPTSPIQRNDCDGLAMDKTNKL